ncbi:hypothetical protein SFRURICE_004787 [Spodoptera frugiperda]|nr:hypothetical protein SFRURICE_004787 [Spodoptera frugiperda]
MCTSAYPFGDKRRDDIKKDFAHKLFSGQIIPKKIPKYFLLPCLSLPDTRIFSCVNRSVIVFSVSVELKENCFFIVLPKVRLPDKGSRDRFLDFIGFFENFSVVARSLELCPQHFVLQETNYR